MLILALVIVLGAAIVLVVPVRVSLDLGIAEEALNPSVHMQASWLFFSWRDGKARRARPERARRPRSRTQSSVKPGSRHVFAVLRTPGFLGRVGRLAFEVLRALTPRTVEGWVRFGFEDPVSTGVFVGAAHAALRLAQATAWKLRVEPEFAGPAFAGHVRFVWAVRPGAVLWPVGTFVASPVTWRAVFAALRASGAVRHAPRAEP